MSDILSILRYSIDFVMDLTYIELWGISVFEVALLGFLAFSLFRFIISPLIGGSFSWNLFNTVSDTVKASNTNKRNEKK